MFDPCFAELDCGDEGVPLVVQMFEFSLLSKAPKGQLASSAHPQCSSSNESAAELFSATKQLISVLKHGLTLQCL
jgi:hypothetical protein